MFNKKIKIILICLLFYQSPLFSKSNSFNDFNSNNISKYFSGIVAFENKDNSEALNYFNSSKILLDKHDPYLEKFVMSLVLENKVSQAINIIKVNSEKTNSDFFEAYLLLALNSLKKNDFDQAINFLSEVSELLQKDRFNYIIVNSLIEYLHVFNNKEIKKDKEKFGNLSLISEAFQRCYLDDKNTDTFFSTLINNNEADYSRYIFFYLTYLIDKKRLEDAKELTNKLDYINTTLLLSQGKCWIVRDQIKELSKVFSCNNHNDIIGLFLF